VSKNIVAVVATGALLALGALVISGARLQAQTPFSPASTATSGTQGISAVGQGTASLPPDKAVISASVQTNATAGPDALSQNSQTVQAVVAALKALGVTDAGIQTTQLTLYPVYPSQSYSYALSPGISVSQPQPSSQPPVPPAVSYFEASEGISVTTTDLSTVPDLVQAMVNAGITTFSGVQFTWQDPEKLRTMAVEAASADAQAQAQALAASLGVSLGAVLSSSETYSSAPPVPYLATPAATAAPPPPIPGVAFAQPFIQPGQQSATASVSVTYAIAGH